MRNLIKHSLLERWKLGWTFTPVIIYPSTYRPGGDPAYNGRGAADARHFTYLQELSYIIHNQSFQQELSFLRKEKKIQESTAKERWNSSWKKKWWWNGIICLLWCLQTMIAWQNKRKILWAMHDTYVNIFPFLQFYYSALLFFVFIFLASLKVTLSHCYWMTRILTDGLLTG